ncbi:uncharacterized protein, partial [Palaemon carinicauda]|uniref:uncharacterized protein n=1 Tax=Palaemon carinicauda TaxID=392227 RepID=UPI0035B5F963
MSEVLDSTEKDLQGEGQEEELCQTPQVEEEEIDEVSVTSVPDPKPVPDPEPVPSTSSVIPYALGRTLSSIRRSSQDEGPQPKRKTKRPRPSSQPAIPYRQHQQQQLPVTAVPQMMAQPPTTYQLVPQQVATQSPIFNPAFERQTSSFRSRAKGTARADALSRFTPIESESSLVAGSFSFISSQVTELQIDLFATKDNKKMDRYVFPYGDPLAEAVDVMSLDWNRWS